MATNDTFAFCYVTVKLLDNADFNDVTITVSSRLIAFVTMHRLEVIFTSLTITARQLLLFVCMCVCVCVCVCVTVCLFPFMRVCMTSMLN